MRGIVVDMKNPSKAFLEGYPNSNCEQFQELLGQVSKGKRNEFVKKMQKHYQELLETRKAEFEVCVKQLNDEITKFLSKDGVSSVLNESCLKFNGFVTTKSEPFFYEQSIFEQQLKDLKLKKYDTVEELETLTARASKHLFSSLYKKKEREELQKAIFEYDQKINKLTEEYETKKNNYETREICFKQAKPVLEAVERVTFLTNSIHKISRLLDFMSVDHKISAKKFVEEYKDAPITIDKNLAYAEQIGVIVENNDLYKKEMPVSFMKDNRDEAVNLEVEVQNEKTQGQEMVR